VVAINTAIDFTADFTDDGEPDTHAATWDWGDSGGCDTAGPSPAPPEACAVDGHTVTGSHAYAAPGVYQVSLTVTDDDGGISNEMVYRFIAIYDPSAGFVTGGGWINSQAEACPDFCGGATGRANFGFVAKYKRGKNEPDGNTEFNFKAGGLNFHSSSYDWLVIAGAQAKFKGLGTINDVGNYGFMLSATDGDILGNGVLDKFRIKIWDKDADGALVYDNQKGELDDADPTTVIGGGNIVIHTGGKGPKAGKDGISGIGETDVVEVPDAYELHGNYPNPFNPQTTVTFGLPEPGMVSLIVYDMLGRPVKVLVDKPMPAGEHRAQFDARDLPSGAYAYRLHAQGRTFTKTMLLAK
jgi:hypothetical protein